MTDDNQSPVTPEETPEFGKQTTSSDKSEVSFGKEDIEKILKQNSNATNHIKTLESETAEMRRQIKELQEELSKSHTIEELLSYERQTNSQNSEPGSKTPQLNEQELLAKLKAEVFNDLTQAQQKSLEEQNWGEANRLAQEKFGEKYRSYVDQKAKELDISVKEMEQYARTSPKVFMQLLGGSTGTKQPQPTRSTQNLNLNSTPDISVQYATLIRARKQGNTPEAREARRILDDPDFQERYRLHILSKG